MWRVYCAAEKRCGKKITLASREIQVLIKRSLSDLRFPLLRISTLRTYSTHSRVAKRRVVCCFRGNILVDEVCVKKFFTNDFHYLHELSQLSYFSTELGWVGKIQNLQNSLLKIIVFIKVKKFSEMNFKYSSAQIVHPRKRRIRNEIMRRPK